MTRQTVSRKIFTLAIAALLIGLGWFANDWYKRLYPLKEKRIHLGGFNFISPLLDVELPEGYDVRYQPMPFKSKIKKFVDQQLKAGTVKNLSVYYRDLSDGPWFTINGRIKYNPASMMKLPVMLAWLKRAENDKSVLKIKYTFDEKAMAVPPQKLKPEQTLEPGRSYTVEELLRFMMNFSDNRALFLLHYALTPTELERVINEMDVISDVVDGHDVIAVHNYSGFLRILYNASFLSREMSEKALQLMSYDDFPDGIAAGIPQGTRLASKFGEFYDEKRPEVVQLHEFGIVYHPKGPYILGILTRGNNWKGQADILRSISKLVYDSVNLTHKD